MHSKAVVETDSAEASPGRVLTPLPSKIHENEEENVLPPPELVPLLKAEDSSAERETEEEQVVFYTTRNHPYNKMNFRYMDCGPTRVSSVYRYIERAPQTVRFDWLDRSANVALTSDAQTITTVDRSWRGARVNVPVRQGTYFWEVVIGRGGRGGSDEPHVRLGIGRRESSLGVPVGFDATSYGYRDVGGEKVTLSTPVRYGVALKKGDVVGVCLTLPARLAPIDRRDPARVVRRRIPIRYKGQMYFELAEYPKSKELESLEADGDLGVKKKEGEDGTENIREQIPILKGSSLSFYVNGQPQGVAFSDLFDFLPPRPKKQQGTKKKKTATLENNHDDGTLGYYPFVSVFGGGVAALQAGPDFSFFPDELKSKGHVKPLSERYTEYLAEQRFMDDADVEEAAKRPAENDNQGDSLALSMPQIRDDSDGTESGRAGHRREDDPEKKDPGLLAPPPVEDSGETTEEEDLGVLEESQTVLEASHLNESDQEANGRPEKKPKLDTPQSENGSL